MIVKIGKSGHSFTGLSAYLTHDPQAATADRVAWTYTRNLANDHVPSAVDEMLWTFRDAELLKQEAGVRAGGRATEHPVKHISLNWHPDDNPSQKHMIATGEHFLQSMGWQEHQAIFVAHCDKAYRHVHIVLNEVHPETGLRLNDNFERVRAQKWAAAYEREQGNIRCEQREIDPALREKSMPRNMWLEFKNNEQEFLRSEQGLRDNSGSQEYSPENRRSAEWKILKDIHRSEREQFFVDGKQEFKELRSSIYREIREDYRERWADYFRADKMTVGDERRFLPDVKAQIIADRKAALEPRRDAACAELREARKLKYQELLDSQREERVELKWRLDAGLDNSDFFHDLVGKRERRDEVAMRFRDAAAETTRNCAIAPIRSSDWAEVEHQGDRASFSRRGLVQVAEFGPRKVAASVGSFVDGVFTFLTNLGSAPPEPISAEERAEQFRQAAEDALKQQQAHIRLEEDETWRLRHNAYSRE